MVKGVFHIGLKLINFSNYCSSTCLQLKLSNAISAMAAPIYELNSMEKSQEWVKLQIQTSRRRKIPLNAVNKNLNTDRPSVPLTGDEHQPRVGGVS